MIFLLEFLQPASAVRLEVAFVVAHSRSKESRFLANDCIIERQTLSLMVPSPICKSSFDVREFAF